MASRIGSSSGISTAPRLRACGLVEPILVRPLRHVLDDLVHDLAPSLLVKAHPHREVVQPAHYALGDNLVIGLGRAHLCTGKPMITAAIIIALRSPGGVALSASNFFACGCISMTFATSLVCPDLISRRQIILHRGIAGQNYCPKDV